MRGGWLLGAGKWRQKTMRHVGGWKIKDVYSGEGGSHRAWSLGVNHFDPRKKITRLRKDVFAKRKWPKKERAGREGWQTLRERKRKKKKKVSGEGRANAKKTSAPLWSMPRGS